MNRIEQWPPPEWVEVVVTWAWIMSSHRHDIGELIKWVNKEPGGDYYLYGKGKHFDFAFRFERPSDATDRKSTRLNSSHIPLSRMPSSA